MSSGNESHGEKWGLDWRINIQTVLAVFILLGGNIWWTASTQSSLQDSIANHTKQIEDFRVNGTPSVRVEISNMKARLDAADGRLDRIERGVDRVSDKLDQILNRSK